MRPSGQARAAGPPAGNRLKKRCSTTPASEVRRRRPRGAKRSFPFRTAGRPGASGGRLNAIWSACGKRAFFRRCCAASFAELPGRSRSAPGGSRSAAAGRRAGGGIAIARDVFIASECVSGDVRSSTGQVGGAGDSGGRQLRHHRLCGCSPQAARVPRSGARVRSLANVDRGRPTAHAYGRPPNPASGSASRGPSRGIFAPVEGLRKESVLGQETFVVAPA